MSHHHEHKHEHKHAHESEPEHAHSHDETGQHDHGHSHSHEHHHEHAHSHGHSHHQSQAKPGEKIVTVRALSGLSGDMMLSGLARMNNIPDNELAALVQSLKLPLPEGAVQVRVSPREVNGIGGWGATVSIPHEHSHRSFTDIRKLIANSDLEDRAKELATAAFARLAESEGRVHGKKTEDVTFHEVGALDSILDICLVCALYVRLGADRFVCSPLPLADGSVYCAHGWIPTPAPAVLDMLDDIPVCAFAGQGETLTPTALTLLKTLGADFGPWPEMRIRNKALVYGGKVFPNAPNGVIWAWGESL